MTRQSRVDKEVDNQQNIVENRDMRFGFIFVILIVAMTFCTSCGREAKGLRDEIKMLKEENSFLKAENAALRKEVEEVYGKLEEKSAGDPREGNSSKTVRPGEEKPKKPETVKPKR